MRDKTQTHNSMEQPTSTLSDSHDQYLIKMSNYKALVKLICPASCYSLHLRFAAAAFFVFFFIMSSVFINSSCFFLGVFKNHPFDQYYGQPGHIY
jgi:hypothetical protein